MDINVKKTCYYVPGIQVLLLFQWCYFTSVFESATHFGLELLCRWLACCRENLEAHRAGTSFRGFNLGTRLAALLNCASSCLSEGTVIVPSEI